MFRRFLLPGALACALAASFCLSSSEGPSVPFLVDPYLQLGDNPRPASEERLAVMWHTVDAVGGWSVEVKTGLTWKAMPAPVSKRVNVPTVAPHLVWTAKLEGLTPGADFQYRISRDGKVLHTSNGRARKSASQPYKFVATGDCAAGTPGQLSIANQMQAANPDFLFVAGDIVYSRGRISEYRAKYFPVYNAGATPLLRSTLFIAVPGNHDLATRDFAANPDTLAYYLYWSQPLNGPDHPALATLNGPPETLQAFRSAAGGSFPRMGSFSFDYGNAHWTLIDSNRYVDWTDAQLLKWVEDDLASARNATWRFVGFHHPGFNSSVAHRGDQWTRLLAPVFEKHGVDIVFSGHVHNYQRSMPMRFEPAAGSKHGGLVEGKWTLDRSFDGAAKTKADGVMYVVTGACGAGLYNKEQQDNKASWLEFTTRFYSQRHSITVADIAGKKATFRQVADNGEVVDTFVITK